MQAPLPAIEVGPAERSDRLTLAGGRVLAWREWGPERGRPVLLCTGAGMSSALGLDREVLAALDVRLIVVDRPGLGGSSPDRRKTLFSVATDFGALAEARGFADLPVIGFSQGAPFALALAAGGLVRAAAIVSGQDELTFPDVYRQLPAEVAVMVDAARTDHVRFEADIAAIASADWLSTMTRVMSGPADRAAYERPPFAPLFRQSLVEGFAQGPRGYARDLAIALAPWPFAVEDIAAPVHLWYGAQDTSPVHSPDHGVTLARRLRAAPHVIDPEAGSALLWTRTRDILAAVLADG
ncbi:alpha/beta hydrolase [Nannocystis sp. ILAH1]|uniref:alpha/beta fold hydrolase n=1 Tax=unclassified Nannocystis TaxID=2627009 RepID=UPI00227127E8|nr:MULTISPECIES: alpha/beta hydrolase [unclassified Nannocystis]MCY0987968.1 alpha/beta hydrolase [Nannocystis sp. ILAH1]MCY1065689.1 alpha/beta hydrolase [Nannocystis sp. RBIL2]